MRPIVDVYRQAFSGLSRDLWLLGVIALINRSGTMVLPFISLYLTAERGLAARDAGQLVALYGVGAAGGAYLGGWLADRIGAIRAQQTSLALGGLSYLVLGAVTERWILAVVIFVSGLVVEAFRPAVMAAYAERTEPELKAKAFAFLRLAVNLGVGIGPAVGGFLALYSYRWLFYLDAATCWIAALLLVSVPEHREGARPGAASGDSRSPWRDAPFLVLLVLVMLMASVLFQVFSTYPLYLREHAGFREDGIGALLSLNAFIIVAFEMVLIHLVRKKERMVLVGAGAFFLCVGFGLTAVSDAVPWLVFTVCVWTLGEMLALPILNVVVSERAGPGVQGQYMGLYSTAYALAFVLAPLGGTYLYQRFGPATLWSVVGALGFVLGAASLALKTRLQPPDRDEPQMIPDERR